MEAGDDSRLCVSGPWWRTRALMWSTVAKGAWGLQRDSKELSDTRGIMWCDRNTQWTKDSKKSCTVMFIFFFIYPQLMHMAAVKQSAFLLYRSHKGDAALINKAFILYSIASTQRSFIFGEHLLHLCIYLHSVKSASGYCSCQQVTVC